MQTKLITIQLTTDKW